MKAIQFRCTLQKLNVFIGFTVPQSACMHISTMLSQSKFLISLVSCFFRVRMPINVFQSSLLGFWIILDRGKVSFGRGISSSLRLLPTQDKTYKHSCPQQDSNPPSQEPSGQNLHLIPRRHRDRLLKCCNRKELSKCLKVLLYVTLESRWNAFETSLGQSSAKDCSSGSNAKGTTGRV